jgi:hypothetical protein
MRTLGNNLGTLLEHHENLKDYMGTPKETKTLQDIITL